MKPWAADALLALFRGKVTPVEQLHAGGSAPVYNLQRPTEIAHVKRGAKNGMAVDAFLRKHIGPGHLVDAGPAKP